MCSGGISSSYSFSGTLRVTIVTNPVISHEWGKDRIYAIGKKSKNFQWKTEDATTRSLNKKKESQTWGKQYGKSIVNGNKINKAKDGQQEGFKNRKKTQLPRKDDCQFLLYLI